LNFEIVRNLAKFSMFWPLNFLNLNGPLPLDYRATHCGVYNISIIMSGVSAIKGGIDQTVAEFDGAWLTTPHIDLSRPAVLTLCYRRKQSDL